VTKMTTERQNNQEQNKSSDQAEQNKTAQQSNKAQPGNASESPLYGGKGDQGQMDNAVGPERYSYHGPHGNYDPNEGTAPDGYGDQDQYGYQQSTAMAGVHHSGRASVKPSSRASAA